MSDVGSEAYQAYQRSLALLRTCQTPAGFVASPVNIENYARVWARDGVITGLAALASGEIDLIEGMHHTLTTLATHQGPHGEIPSNVSLNGQQVSYGTLVGRVDSLLWYVIGVCAYVHATGATQHRNMHRPVVERALFLAGCWEYNNRGLLYVPVAGDWADEYIQEGYVLYDELLYLLALRGAGALYGNAAWKTKATQLEQLLNVNYWPRADAEANPLIYHPYAYQKQLAGGETAHWLPAFSPAGYATYFDGFAHALTLLTDLGDAEQRAQAERYAQSLAQQTGSVLLPAFWPVIQPGDALWGRLEENHLYGQLKNQPYQYHNGGLWPMINGFYAVGLARHGAAERARQLLSAINAANEQGNDGTHWAFAEYHSGQTHAPLGTTQVAWSAAAGVMAYQAVTGQAMPWPF